MQEPAPLRLAACLHWARESRSGYLGIGHVGCLRRRTVGGVGPGSVGVLSCIAASSPKCRTVAEAAARDTRVFVSPLMILGAPDATSAFAVSARLLPRTVGYAGRALRRGLEHGQVFEIPAPEDDEVVDLVASRHLWVPTALGAEGPHVLHRDRRLLAVQRVKDALVADVSLSARTLR